MILEEETHLTPSRRVVDQIAIGTCSTDGYVATENLLSAFNAPLSLCVQPMLIYCLRFTISPENINDIIYTSI